jgi:arabinogalactan oligomer/maltooligosaccharide transport system permease protein
MTTLDMNTSVAKIPFWQSRRFQRAASMGIRYVIALLLVLFAVLPALWVISSSLNPAKSLVGGTLWPKNPVFTNYMQLLDNEYFTYEKGLVNSLNIE